jgi:hypothetical protein
MFNEMERLGDSPLLQTLLGRYAALAAPDRQAWQDRCMELDGTEPRDLSGLHGELIAYGWLEQNTGVVEAPCQGGARATYRVTPAGLRAVKALRRGEREAA